MCTSQTANLSFVRIYKFYYKFVVKVHKMYKIYKTDTVNNLVF
jgi:hypothetical protein